VLDLQINNACNGVKLSEIDRQRLYRRRYNPGESERELRLALRERAAEIWWASARYQGRSCPRPSTGINTACP
jgi:hypothetical protein